MYSAIGSLPEHQYVWVDSVFTHRSPHGFIPAIWFGLSAYPARAWGCTVMLESGAIYRNLPPHALAFSPAPEPSWTIDQAQTWDCYGRAFSCHAYTYLHGLWAMVRAGHEEYEGQYLFTVAPIGDGFSANPEQSKEFTFFRLENKRLTIQPTNRIVFIESSFTIDPPTFPTDLKRQTDIYTCEQEG